MKGGRNLGNSLLSHYAAGNAGAGKTRGTRDGRPRVSGTRRGRTSEQIVVITVLAVIGSYCGEVTTGPPPEPARQVTVPPAGLVGSPGRGRHRVARKAWTGRQ